MTKELLIVLGSVIAILVVGAVIAFRHRRKNRRNNPSDDLYPLW